MNVALNPAQEHLLALLRDRRHSPCDPDLGPQLRARLEAELRPLARGLTEPAVVTKAILARVLACEAHHQAEQEAPSFAWSPATAKGTVAHKAIELSVHRRDRPPPLVLVDDALTRLADHPEHPVASYLLGLGEAERAELRGEVNDVVAKFVEVWPPLSRAWVPRTESRVRAELCGGMVRLSGKVDLALGTASGTKPGALLVDLKSGASHGGHLDDLRFYALLETLRVGVPPFRLAGYYLDAGTLSLHDVDDDLLEAAVRRTVAGVRRVLELRLGLRRASITSNPACRWCRLRPDCNGARQWLAASPAERAPD